MRKETKYMFFSSSFFSFCFSRREVHAVKVEGRTKARVCCGPEQEIESALVARCQREIQTLKWELQIRG